MKDILYRKIYKALNEDLNMILSDDDFEEPEIDLGVHIQNIQKTVYNNVLIKKVDNAIKDKQSVLLKQLIEEWDGETAFYPVNNDNIRDTVKFSIKALGNKANLNWIDTSNVTDMWGMFYHSKFNGDISRWDVSHVTNMKGMFRQNMFNGDISKWDVSNVTDMSYMFNKSEFNGDISKWNVSSVKNMMFMFYDSIFNGDISGWDVSSVTNMSYMFTDSVFNGDISRWDVSNVINMREMFAGSKFNQDISSWSISKGIDMFYIFYQCPIKEEYKPKFEG